MPDQPLTLMAVHAHPDDEALGTGGVLARYADEGIRTVLVTCTDGRWGDGPNGIKPGEPGHDPDAVVAQRAGELEASCAILGVRHLERLGYPDSGMMGWSYNEQPGSFWSTPVDDAATRLAELFERYRPQVVVTYDANGFYGHPDHIQAHRITMAATERTGIPDKVYFTALARSRMDQFRRRMAEAGFDPPGGDGDDEPLMGVPDEQIAAWVDVSRWTDRKYRSLAAHASQTDNSFFLNMPQPVFAEMMGDELFVRDRDRTGAPLPEDDLFAGLRSR